MFMSFGPSSRSCFGRARKMEIARRHKAPGRRPIVRFLDDQISPFDIDKTEEIVAVTANPRSIQQSL